MTTINVSLICLSLKYINDKYEDISDISKWVYYELGRHNYTDHKLLRSLDIEDYKIIKSIIKFNKDKDVLTKDLIYFCKINEIKLIKLLIDNGANIHVNNDEALRWASYYSWPSTVKLLIDNGANIHANNDEALKQAKINGHVDIVKLLIDNGAKMN